MRRREPLDRKSSAGYTLIEVMAAGLVLAVAIAGVMTMLSVGRKTELENGFRRRARIIAASALEDSLYQSNSYVTLAASPLFAPTVLLDSSSAHPVSATLFIIHSEEGRFTAPWRDSLSYPAPQIIYQEIRSTVSWTVAGQTDTVMYYKRVAKIQ